VSGDDLECCRCGRYVQCVGVEPEEQRFVDVLGMSVPADGLGDGEDMRLIERTVQRRPAVPRSAEHHPLRRDPWVRNLCVVGRHQPADVHEVHPCSGP
jgi:hypothetical protein